MKTSLSSAVKLGASSLARFQFGDATAVQLARSDITHSSPGSAQELSRLLAITFGLINLNDF